MTAILHAAPGVARTVRVRMAGRGDVEVFVRDTAVPAIIAGNGRTGHTARVVAAEAAERDVVVPFEPALASAKPRRLAAYLSGRYCALRALSEAGSLSTALPIGEAGAPAWPMGSVGSIAHSATRAIAVVGSAARWRGIGVDCESVVDTTAAEEIVRMTLPEAEAVMVTGVAALSWAEFVTVGFSAKESLYKCLRPIVNTFFDFDDAHLVQLDRDTQRVRIRLMRDLAPGFARDTAFELAFAIADDHVYTCLALPAIAGPTAPEYAQ